MIKRVSQYLLGFSLFITLAHATSYNCTMFSASNSGATNIMGINNSGALVGSYRTFSPLSECAHEQTCHGFMGSLSGGSSTLDYPGATNTLLFAVNNNGVATGAFSGGTAGSGWFTVTGGVFTKVNVSSPYTLVSIYGINDDGDISAVVNTGAGRSFAILGPNGTVTLVPGYTSTFLTQPGSINNGLVMLEAGNSGSQLVDSSGHITPVPIPNAFGVNNLGTVVGFQGPGAPGFNAATFGFSRDSSGVVSDVFCPGVAPGFSSAITRSINDNGVIAGGPFVLTPIPGQPQITISANSLSFPPTPVGQSSSPLSVTVSNTGNARLDIGMITPSSSEFKFSGCVDPITGAGSLNAGVSCTLAVTATPSAMGSRTGTITSTNSAPGSPGQISVSVTGTAAPPSCSLSSLNPGPPAQANFIMVDTNTGLKSIVLLDATNANVNVPSFQQGTTSPVTATAVQVHGSQSSKVDFQVTNVAGGATTCGATFGGPTQWTGLGGILTSKIAVARNADGRLQAFVRGTDNALWTMTQAQPDNGWSSWVSLGGVLSSDPVAGVNQDGRVQVFVIGTDSVLWTNAQSSPGGSFSGWQSLAGILISDPAVATDAHGDLEVVAIGTDRALWVIAQTSPGGSWTGWNSLGGVVGHNPALIANQDGRLQTFAMGASDNAIWTSSQTSPGGSWSGWTNLGGSLSGDLSVAMNQDGRLQAFAMGTDNALWTAAQTTPGGVWSGFSSLAGVISSNPAATINANGTLEVFARGSDFALWHLAQTTPGGSWSDLATLSGVLEAPVSAAQNQNGRVAAFVEGTDGGLWTIEQTAPGFWN